MSRTPTLWPVPPSGETMRPVSSRAPKPRADRQQSDWRVAANCPQISQDQGRQEEVYPAGSEIAAEVMMSMEKERYERKKLALG